MHFALKAALARLPVKRASWQRLGIFDHGPMADPAYARRVFDRHFCEFRRYRAHREFAALELGPGNSLSSALLAAAQGAIQTYLIDVEAAASQDMTIYRELVRALESTLDAPDAPFRDRVASAAVCADAAAMLQHLNARYLTDGIASLRSIPNASIDFLWSHTVLQYVRHDEFDEYARELRRIVRPGGVGSHEVDFRDMMGGRLNHLRFPDQRWHTGFVLGSDVYTNRLRCSHMVRAFERAGFNVEIRRVERFAELPLPRNKLAAPFRDLGDEDLRIALAHFVLH